MRRLVIAVALTLLVAGCGQFKRFVRPPPVQAMCDAMCYRVDAEAPPELNTSCASKAQWTGNPLVSGAWERLTQGTIPELRKETWDCGVRLRACQDCIDRLVKAGVIKKP